MSSRPPLRLEKRESLATLQASKWLQIQMLLDEEEIDALFSSLGDIYLVRNSSIATMEELFLTQDSFIKHYSAYVTPLKRGQLPDLQSFRRNFSLVLTSTLDALFVNEVEKERYIVKVAKPIVQIQPHAIHYSKLDNKFRSMVFGRDTISWGLQFSYPQIYQDPATMRIEKAGDSDRCINAALFRTIQKWQRKETKPTPFIVDSNRSNVPMRLGKHCFPWINNHPQLKEQNIEVHLNNED